MKGQNISPMIRAILTAVSIIGSMARHPGVCRGEDSDTGHLSCRHEDDVHILIGIRLHLHNICMRLLHRTEATHTDCGCIFSRLRHNPQRIL